MSGPPPTASDTYYQFLNGDGEIVAASGIQNTNAWAKTGVVFRDVGAAAKTSVVHVTPDDGTVFRRLSRSTGGSSNGFFLTPAPPPE